MSDKLKVSSVLPTMEIVDGKMKALVVSNTSVKEISGFPDHLTLLKAEGGAMQTLPYIQGTYQSVVNTLCDYLIADPQLLQSWTANIASSFEQMLPDADVSEEAHSAATQFIDNFIMGIKNAVKSRSETST